MGAIEYMAGVMLIGALVFTPYALLTSMTSASLHGSEWLWILFIVLVPGCGRARRDGLGAQVRRRLASPR